MIYKIAAFYKFIALEDAAAVRLEVKSQLANLDLCGTLLVAPEGINGTLAGCDSSIEDLLVLLDKHFSVPASEVKFSYAEEKPFNRLKVRLKREIISFREPAADPLRKTGRYVEPEDWNALLDDPEVLLLDTRNNYETRLGMFAGAEDPKIDQFSDFALYARQHLDPTKHRKIAMYCTGGIRCEKASSFLLQEGFAEVYHLKGGILKYLERVPEAQSRWRGDCYIFDKRMAVGPGLTSGHYTMCYSCGQGNFTG